MPDDTLILRPSMRTEAVWLMTSTLGFAAIFLPYLLWLFLQPNDPGAAERDRRVFSLGGVFALVIAVNFIVLLLARRNRAIFVNAEAFGETTWFGKRRTFPRSDLGEVRWLAVRHRASDPVPRLILTNAAGQRLLDLRPAAWTEDDLTQLTGALGVEPVGSRDDVLTPHDFAARYPLAQSS